MEDQPENKTVPEGIAQEGIDRTKEIQDYRPDWEDLDYRRNLVRSAIGVIPQKGIKDIRTKSPEEPTMEG